MAAIFTTAGQKLLATVLVSSVVCLCSNAQTPADSATAHLHLGDEALHNGRYGIAKAEYETAAALAPGNSEVWYDFGILYGETANFVAAEQAFRRAITADPQSAKAHCRLGQTLVADPRSKQDWPAAVAEFREALKLQPVYPEAESFLGLGLTNLGQTDDAIAALKHAIQLDPGLAAAHLDLAIALQDQDKLADAVKEYQTSLNLKPHAPETQAALGSLFLRMEDIAQAEAAFRAAIQLDPDAQDAHYGLARVFKAQKKTTESATEFEQASALAQREPDHIQATRQSNESLRSAAQGDLPGAIAMLKKALQLRPDYGVADYNLGLILADSGDLTSARQALIKAASLLPGEPKVWFDLGRVLLKLGDKQNAEQTIAWAAALAPANRSFAAELASLRASDNSPSESPVQAPSFGARSDTTSDHLAFAAQLRSQGDLLGAKGELLRALAITPNYLEARKELAAVCRASGDQAGAVLEYRKLLLAAGDNAETREDLGNTLLTMGKAAEAADQFRVALQLNPGSQTARSSLQAALRAAPPSEHAAP